MVSERNAVLYASHMTPSTPDQFVTNDPSLLGNSPTGSSMYMYESEMTDMQKAVASPISARQASIGYTDVSLASPAMHHTHTGMFSRYTHTFMFSRYASVLTDSLNGSCRREIIMYLSLIILICTCTVMHVLFVCGVMCMCDRYFVFVKCAHIKYQCFSQFLAD